jgi:hypothetical protein
MTALAKTIEIADGLIMDPSEAATQTLGAIAAKGGGKSYLVGKFVEGLHDAGAPFVVLDPMGNWHPLQLGADGKSPGLSVVIIGGDRADVPLVEEKAAGVARYLLRGGVSAVVDVSELSKTKRKVYVAEFCEALYGEARKQRKPYMVVFEEAQLFAPQHAARGEERMLGAVTDIVRLGRAYGLGSMLVTQRPQSVSKEVLNQVECLFVGQLRGPQERKAIRGWVDEQGKPGLNSRLDELPTLEAGEFFCWSPSWLRLFQKVRVGKKRTFDGSSTPTLGGKGLAPAIKMDRSMDGFVEMLKALSLGDGDIGSEAASQLIDGAAQAEAVEAEKVARLRLAQVEQENTALWTRVEQLEKAVRTVKELLGSVHRHLEEADELRNVTATVLPRVSEVDADTAPRHLDTLVDWPSLDPLAKVTKRPPKAPGEPQRTFKGLDKPEAAILRELAWQKGAISKKRLALLAGYAAKGGGFGNALGRLRSRGFVEGSSELTATQAGIRMVSPVFLPPSKPEALFQWWLEHRRVDKPMRAILEALQRAFQPMPVDTLAESSGYVPGTGGFGNALGRLRTLGLVQGGRKQPIELVAELRLKSGRAA